MLSRKQAIAAAISLISVLMSPAAVADTLTIPNTFTPGTTIQSAQMNGNFGAITTWSTLISNSNIKVGAAIAPSKLDFTLEIGPILRTAANDCFAAGVTGDTQPRWAVTSDGFVKLGPGGSTTADLSLIRSAVSELSVRNGANSADAALKCGNLTSSGTVTFTSPLSVASGGTGASSLAGNGAVVMNAGGTAQTVVAPGASGNVLVSNGTAWTSGTAASQALAKFGGDGGSGAISNFTYTGSGNPVLAQVNATTWTIATGTSGNLPAIVNCTSTFTIAGTGSAGSLLGGAGGTALSTASKSGMRGFGPAPGEGGLTANVGGGGGGAGSWSSGGAAGKATTGAAGEGGGGIIATSSGAPPLVGSGGGTGSTGAGGTAAAGGSGGGIIRVCAVGAITIGSSGNAFNAAGQTGGNAATLGGGSGGGGGGSVFLYSQASITTGGATITVVGGAGGTGTGASSGGGGGGGGGLCVRMSPSNGAITVTTTASSGGSGTGASGSGGGAGVDITLTGTPNLPLIAYHNDMKGLRANVLLAQAKRFIRGGEIEHIALNHREHSQCMAAWYAKPGKFDSLCMALMYGGGRETANLACIDVAPSFDAVRVQAAFPSSVGIEQTATGDFDEIANAA